MHAGMMQPWKPGQSGNPAGKTKAVWRMTDLAREKGPEAIQKLVDLMRNSPDDRVQYMAATHLLDRGFGKPKQQDENSENRPMPTPEERLEMLHEIARRLGYSLEPAK